MALMQRISGDAAIKRREDPKRECLESVAEKLLTPLFSTWVPNEIVTPPIPMDALSEIDALCADLRSHGARGTRASPIYAFGMHLNPEMPEIPLERVPRYLGAFILLQDRLREETRMDFTRQLTLFARPFPVEYARRILAVEYQPDFETFADEYLAANPTRNRALDLLPLLAHYDEPRVRRVVDDERVRARPTFHYRLPNCDLDDPAWTVSGEWNRWVEVERLAEDGPRFRAMADAWLAQPASALSALLSA